MNSSKGATFLGRHQALSISAIYLVISGIWIYISNYLLFGQVPIIEIHTLAEIEAISDGIVVLVTAVLIYLLVRRSIFVLQQSEGKLKEQAERLQILSHELMHIQESERRMLARELHDEIGQALTGLKLSLENAGRLAEKPLRERIEGAAILANGLIARVRNLSLNLRPAGLDDLGLLPALLWHFERYTNQTGLQVDFRHQGLGERRFERDLETVACRIIQEALTNVARHAKTEAVNVRVWVGENSLNVRVEDCGAGFDAKAFESTRGSGLSGMEERASIIGGSLLIESQPGRGTQLIAELPLNLGAHTPSALSS